MSAMDTDIDEGLYSRQLYVLGHDAMRRMQVRWPRAARGVRARGGPRTVAPRAAWDCALTPPRLRRHPATPQQLQPHGCHWRLLHARRRARAGPWRLRPLGTRRGARALC